MKRNNTKQTDKNQDIDISWIDRHKILTAS